MLRYLAFTILRKLTLMYLYNKKDKIIINTNFHISFQAPQLNPTGYHINQQKKTLYPMVEIQDCG